MNSKGFDIDVWNDKRHQTIIYIVTLKMSALIEAVATRGIQ